jgi:diacylglycerol kinase
MSTPPEQKGKPQDQERAGVENRAASDAPQKQPVENAEEAQAASVEAATEGEPEVLVTPEGEEIELSVLGTMKLDPDAGKRKVKKNVNRLASVKFAIAGLLYVLRREQSIQLASIVTLVVVVIGIWVDVNEIRWALIILALGAVWITECLNTAIEAAIDIGAEDVNKLAKIGKDVASAAALVATIVFVLVVVIALARPITDALRPITGS